MFDPIDRKLLLLLQKDGRQSNAELGEAVNLSPSSVHERVRKLEKSGTIRGYSARVDPEGLGKGLLAYMRLSSGGGEGPGPAVALSSLCAAEDDILECHHVAGEDCYILKLRSEGPRELETLIERIRSSSKASRSVTSIVLSSVKDSTLVAPAPGLEARETGVAL